MPYVSTMRGSLGTWKRNIALKNGHMNICYNIVRQKNKELRNKTAVTISAVNLFFRNQFFLQIHVFPLLTELNIDSLSSCFYRWFANYSHKLITLLPRSFSLLLLPSQCQMSVTFRSPSFNLREIPVAAFLLQLPVSL